MSGLDCRGSECAIWILLDCQKTYVGPLLWGWITPGALLGYNIKKKKKIKKKIRPPRSASHRVTKSARIVSGSERRG